MSDFYELRRRRAPWGDYGDMLLNGMMNGHTYFDGTQEYSVERAGPFVPPVMFPHGEFLVTSEAKAQIEKAGFTGLTFAPVTYNKVVSIDWRSWDRSADEPETYPANGEPENYIERRKHNPELEASMPAIFVAVVPRIEGLQQKGSRAMIRGQAPDADIVRSYSILWVSGRFERFLSGNFGEWIDCVPADQVDP
ncbi:MAG: hypothetical protein OXQ92_16190 [Boseongicola sp.]|nr:hypothetical protein [Boseongicola sp.]MDD9979668.1 hypothetical protein [Boseongicola sp.]